MINDKLLLESLHIFYRNEYNRDKLLLILSDKKQISLRSIDWFITNYSKKYNTYYIVYENDESKIPSFESSCNNYRSNMNVFHSYKSQLKAYSKKKFDPFCRRDRLSFKIDDEWTVETTIGQLNFFKWAISNLVLEFIEINKVDIEGDMNTSLKQMKLNHIEKGGLRKKRQELSLSATRGLSMNRVPIEISFE
jgi:hypothetical protein|tara:strand:+ start:77 stop:655 length:579 start_codon:yes stop_codon:yes gene_type:complete